MSKPPARPFFHMVGMTSGKGTKGGFSAVVSQQSAGLLGSRIHGAHEGARASAFFGSQAEKRRTSRQVAWVCSESVEPTGIPWGTGKAGRGAETHTGHEGPEGEEAIQGVTVESDGLIGGK